jgi:hypothetical protein
MKRADAIKALSKLLGKRLMYEEDPKAPTSDERSASSARLRTLNADLQLATAHTAARRAEVLKADTEYQRLLSKQADLTKERDLVRGECLRYRITVGIDNGFAFAVTAQADNWAEAVAAVKSKTAQK